VLLLALDTSGATVTTVALHDGERVLAERTVGQARRHAEVLAPGIAGVLAAAGRRRQELTDIAVGIGPGPFTGLRVGLVTARVLGRVLEIPVHGVCSLDVIADASGLSGDYLVATDARRREVYWARYDGPTRVTGPDVAAPSAVPRDGARVAGRGAALYPGELGPALEPLDVSAADLAGLVVRRLAEGVPLLPPDPLYLRRPDAVEPGPRKRVTR
jgi:tRNA threonylcarbamoyl adenosine modification protein YeaZ